MQRVNPSHHALLIDVQNATRSERELIEWQPSGGRSTRLQDQTRDQAFLQKIPIELDAYNIMVLNYTMMCPLACDFCCYGCNPRRSETMTKAMAFNLVDQAADLGVFKQFGFTGGEPLTFSDEIIDVARRIWSYGLTHTVTTSGFWATNEVAAHKIVDPLIDAGLAALSVSYDPSHGKWVNPENVRFAANAALKRGCRVVLCASFYDAKAKLESIFPEFIGHPLVEFVNRVVLPVGNASRKHLSQDSYGIQVNTNNFACYKRIYHDLTIFWDGEAYPCCSVYNRNTPGISLGNVYESTLAEIWDRLEGSLLFRTIKHQGFVKFNEIVDKFDPHLANSLPKAADSLGPCQHCHKLFSSSDTKAIHRTFEDYEIEQISQFLSYIRKVVPPEAIDRVLLEALS